MAIYDLGTSDVFVNAGDLPGKQVVLLVGLSPDYTCDIGALDLPTDVSLFFTDSGALRPSAFRQMSPKIVVCPLVGPDFDAIEVATHLAELRYTGTLRVLSLPMRNTDMIISELHQAAPQVEIDLRVMTIAMPSTTAAT